MLRGCFLPMCLRNRGVGNGTGISCVQDKHLIPSDISLVQSFFFAVCLGVIPGGAKETLCNAGIRTFVPDGTTCMASALTSVLLSPAQSLKTVSHTIITLAGHF